MKTNGEMVAYLLGAGYADARVADAMLSVDRGRFVPPGYQEHAYEDYPLPIGAGQTISAPSIVAIMSRELDVRPGMKILEVGAGSGYQAAILAWLAGAKGRVVSVERLSEVAELAKRNLAQFNFANLEVAYGDGTKGYPQEAPYDRIIVTAAAPSIPKPLIEQLKDGGRMLIPVGPSIWQDLILVEKRGGAVSQKSILPVMFVPLVGEYGFR